MTKMKAKKPRKTSNPLELRITKLEKQMIALQLVLRDMMERIEDCMDELFLVEGEGDDSGDDSFE